MRYLDLARAVRERSEESEIRGLQFQPRVDPGITPSTSKGLNSLISLLSHLEARCPELVDSSSWQHSIEDGRRFLAHWGEQAEALGWTSATCSASTGRLRSRTRATGGYLAMTRQG